MVTRSDPVRPRHEWRAADFVGGHPALDFLNTVADTGKTRAEDKLVDWPAVRAWAGKAGLPAPDDLARLLRHPRQDGPDELAALRRFREDAYVAIAHLTAEGGGSARARGGAARGGDPRCDRAQRIRCGRRPLRVAARCAGRVALGRCDRARFRGSDAQRRFRAGAAVRPVYVVLRRSRPRRRATVVRHAHVRESREGGGVQGAVTRALRRWPRRACVIEQCRGADGRAIASRRRTARPPGTAHRSRTGWPSGPSDPRSGRRAHARA